MATDPEARASSSSAVVIGIIALILVVGLAVAYFTMGDRGGGDAPAVVSVPSGGSSTTVIKDTQPVPVPVPDTSGGSTTTTTESSTTTEKSAGDTGTSESSTSTTTTTEK